MWDPVASAAYQWAFGHGGGVLHDQLLLKGIEPRKAFDNLVKEREKAKIAFERERESEPARDSASWQTLWAERQAPTSLVN